MELIDLNEVHGMFVPCAEYTGKEIMERLSQLETVRVGSTGVSCAVSCRVCAYCQHLHGGGMQCRNLHGLNGEVTENDGCSRGKSF